MNRLLLAAVAAAVALLLPLPALACTPLAAKTWRGPITVANHASITNQSFVLGGCQFANDAVNGIDARVFDVSSHRGLAAAGKWALNSAVKPDRVDGTFYTASCSGLPGTGWGTTEPGSTVNFTIPNNAKWMVVTPYTLTPGVDLEVIVTSAGRKCPSS